METVSIEEAADRLGVHYMTVYRYVRIGRLAAERQQGRWRIRVADLQKIAAPPAVTAPPGRRNSARRRGNDPWARRAAGLGDRLLAGDAAGAWAIIESALMSGTPSDVHLRVLAPCLEQIGTEWEKGRISVAEEHRATAVALGIVGRLGPLFGRRGRRRPGVVLLAGAEGDPHAIPLAMVADHMRAEGFDVIHLGADVPVHTLVSMAVAADLIAVGISASTAAGLKNAARAVRMLHRRLPGIPVLLGGPAVRSEEAARQAGADGWAPDAAAAADLLVDRRNNPRPA